MIPFDLSTEDRKLLGHVLPLRVAYLETQIEKFERRQIYSFDAGREGRIKGTATELGKLLHLLDRLEAVEGSGDAA